MYNRDAVLPIDVKHKLSVTDNFDDNEPFEMFDAVLASAIRHSNGDPLSC